MKLKDKIKHKSFWISLVSSVILVVQLLGVKVDVAYVDQVVSAVCGVAMVLGLLIGDGKKDKPSSEDIHHDHDNSDCDDNHSDNFDK